MSDSSERAGLSRLAYYRPVWDRVLFAVALLGVLTTVHLHIQQGRGFDRGCLGFTASEAVEASFNCEAVTTSAAGQVGGVSNAILGIIFYLTVAGLTAGAAFTAGGTRQWLKRGRVALIGIGFAYSVYLSYYQYFVLDDLCALCLISASLATLLFLAQAAELMTSTPSSTSTMQVLDKARGVGYYGALAALILVLIGADIVYFNSLDDPGAIDFEQVAEGEQAVTQPVADTDGEEAGEDTASAEASSPAATPGAEGRATDAAPSPVPQDCVYDPEKGTVEDYMSLVTMSDPAKGSAGASVTVIEYFDPMCPHCKHLHPVMEEVIEAHPEQARYVYKPVVLLGQRSVPPVAALHHAAREGKFFEMLELIFANQKPSGYSLAELRQYAEQIGLNPQVLENRLRAGIYSPTMQRGRQQFIDAGFNSVPTLMIDGKVVASRSRSAECIGSLIEQAAAEGTH